MKQEHQVCKRCLQLFECKAGDIASCQCSTVSISKRTNDFLEKTFWGCLCKNCLKEIDDMITSLAGEVFPDPTDMKEGFHFYKENGLFVFTDRYHILRGSCCKNGCRHCPYGFKK